VLQIFDSPKTDRDLGVDEGVDHQRRLVRGRGDRSGRPLKPGGISRRYVQKDVAIDQSRCHFSERVSDRIWSVVILTSDLPARRLMASAPRPRPVFGAVFTSRAAFPCSWNSTSVFGNNPSFSRISSGIVTWPLDVIRIVLPLPVILTPAAARGYV